MCDNVIYVDSLLITLIAWKCLVLCTVDFVDSDLSSYKMVDCFIECGLFNRIKWKLTCLGTIYITELGYGN
jgi:hypothetical protein